MNSANKLLTVFILVSACYITAIALNIEALVFYVKPLLMLPLLIGVSVSTNFRYKYILVIALAFSWAGDILLLFVFKNEVYFILGLIAFLFAHISYIILFNKELNKANGKIDLKKASLIPITIYLVTLLSVLVPHLGSLTFPVILYAVVICAMLYMACVLGSHWSKPYSGLLISGAISFILSDSILAFDKFYHSLPLAGILIMSTYLYAQWALVKSCLR
ncbi:MAG: lysoplasmalogenase [Ginsengibacter sp.]